MSEACKYCESELSAMDTVYIGSELHTAPKKVQNLIHHYHNMVCYSCYRKMKKMKILTTKEKDLKKIKN